MSSRKKLLVTIIALCCVIFILLLIVLRSPAEFSQEKFVDLYVELSISSEMFSGDSVKLEEERERIFKEAGVAPEEIDKFISRLNQNPDEWAEVWKKIMERLEQRKQELK
jgi:hypothetical protein